MTNELDSIFEKLNITESDIQDELKSSFETAVNEAVKSEKAKIMAEADEFANKKIKEKVLKEKKELEDLTVSFCNRKTRTIAKKYDNLLKEKVEKIENAADDYITEYFEKAFIDKYGKELQAIEESVIVQLNNYLEYSINEKIDNNLIEQAAINETYAPIIKGIQSIFETQFVPLNNSGAKKLKEAKQENIELEKTIREQVNENIILTQKNEALAKKVLISEATQNLSSRNQARAKNFFESKSYAETKRDIDSYVEMLNENENKEKHYRPSSIINEQKIRHNARLASKRFINEAKRRIVRDDVTKNVLTESEQNEVADPKEIELNEMLINSRAAL